MKELSATTLSGKEAISALAITRLVNEVLKKVFLTMWIVENVMRVFIFFLYCNLEIKS
jgi:hypothetical protein